MLNRLKKGPKAGLVHGRKRRYGNSSIILWVGNAGGVLRHKPTPRRAVAFALAGAAAVAAVAAAVVWAVFNLSAPPKTPQAPEVAEVKHAPVAPTPHEVRPDPLAEFAVLPMASAEEVVLHRVPGDGLLPVGAHPLAGTLALATAAEVELDDPGAAWPNVTPAPGFAPMIFAAKPR